MRTPNPTDAPKWAFLLPLVWMAGFAVVAIVSVDGNGGLDMNGDGSVTIRDVGRWLGNAWFVATVAPLAVLVLAAEGLSPGLYRFLEIHAFLTWLGEAGLALLGLACWVGLLVGLMHLESAIRTMLREWADARRLRRERKHLPL